MTGRRFRFRVFVPNRWVVLCAILLFAIHPLLLMFAAGFVASLAGCALDEGGAHACFMLGSDWGEALYNMLVGGWLTIFTLPLGVLLLLLWLVGVLILRWRRKQ